MGAVGRLAAASSGVGAAEVELATSHADGTCRAEHAAHARDDGGLTELELIGYLATQAHGHRPTTNDSQQTVAAIVGISLAAKGGALTANLAAGTEEGVHAHGSVGEAAEGGAVVGHADCLSCFYFPKGQLQMAVIEAGMDTKSSTTAGSLGPLMVDDLPEGHWQAAIG